MSKFKKKPKIENYLILFTVKSIIKLVYLRLLI